MYSPTHFLLPFFLGGVMVRWGWLDWWMVVVAGVIGVVIDADHFVEYFVHIRKKKLSLKGAWNNAVKYHRFSERSFIHHWQGAIVISLLVLGLLFYSWKWAIVVAGGYYTHLLLDGLHLRKERLLRFKIGSFLVRESQTEIILDVILLVGILLLVFI